MIDVIDEILNLPATDNKVKYTLTQKTDTAV